MGKLDGKVAVISGATSGMAQAGATLFVEEGAHVFITGRRMMGRPEEIASVALFLASEDSSYVNGLELVTGGGATVI